MLDKEENAKIIQACGLIGQISGCITILKKTQTNSLQFVGAFSILQIKVKELEELLILF